MTQYIDKSALVAEIERRRRDWHYGSSIEAKYKREECDDILSFLNNLEVKEVKEADFEKMWKEYFKYRGDMATVNVKHLAKHFFELGLKAKGE